MLTIINELVAFQVVYNGVTSYRFKQFADLTRQTDWSIVARLVTIVFLVDRSNIRHLPVIRNNTVLDRFLEDDSEWVADSIFNLNEESWRYVVCTNRLVIPELIQLRHD